MLRTASPALLALALLSLHCTVAGSRARPLPSAPTRAAPRHARLGHLGRAAFAAPPPPPPPPQRALEFTIEAEPSPLGRHRYSSKQRRMWNPSAAKQAAFLAAARPHLPAAPLAGPLDATLVFRMKRPQAHYRTGRYAGELKTQAPAAFSTKKCDLDNLAKFVLDAINAEAFDDDSQVVSLRAAKLWDRPGGGGCTYVRLEPVSDAEVGDWVPGR